LTGSWGSGTIEILFICQTCTDIGPIGINF
jgi:hypothetical protein